MGSHDVVVGIGDFWILDLVKWPIITEIGVMNSYTLPGRHAFLRHLFVIIPASWILYIAGP